MEALLPPFSFQTILIKQSAWFTIVSTGDRRGPIKNISVSGEAVTAILDNLHPSFLYNIRIRANNSVGLGSPSHQIAAKLLEEGKSYFHFLFINFVYYPISRFRKHEILTKIENLGCRQ